MGRAAKREDGQEGKEKRNEQTELARKEDQGRGFAMLVGRMKESKSRP